MDVPSVSTTPLPVTPLPLVAVVDSVVDVVVDAAVSVTVADAVADVAVDVVASATVADAAVDVVVTVVDVVVSPRAELLPLPARECPLTKSVEFC